MNAKAALCMALLEGRVLNVKNCFDEIGLSNIGREVPRMVEKEFDVIVSRVRKTGKNRYGSITSYTNYKLNHTDYNKCGIAKMIAYVREQCSANSSAPKTKKEEKIKKKLEQIELF